MNKKTSYFKIGMFIIIGIVIFVVGLIVFGGGEFLKKKLEIESYFNGSVQGLNIGSPLKFRGIKVGEVTEMSLVGELYKISQDVPDAYKYNLYVLVRGVVYIENFEKFAPKDEAGRDRNINRLIQESGLRVKLIPLGITGGAYLELDFVKPQFAKETLEIVWKPKYLYIPSVPGTLEQVTKALSEIPEVLNQDVYPMLKNVNESAKTFPAIIEKIDEILLNTRLISGDIRDVSMELKENPSRVIFGDAPPKKGVRK